MFEIPDDLHPDLAPLAWLLGTWRGQGRCEYPDQEPFGFGQEAVFAHDGRPFLHWFARSEVLDDTGAVTGPGPLETGFLRRGEGEEWELVLTHEVGLVQVWYGRTDGPRLELATDLVGRTQTAVEVTAEKRLYGLVEGDLMYAHDRATSQHHLQSYTWARLARVRG